MPPFNPPLTIQEVSLILPTLSNISLIKTGGQGTVFKATHPSYGLCALKVIAPQFSERTEREVISLREIDHQGIIKLLEYNKINLRNVDCPYTLSPYIPGKDLQKCRQDNEIFEENLIKAFLISMTEALKVLWAKRIIHRDIKPGNILKTPSSTFILIDLGIARHLDGTTLSRFGEWFGTIGYMSPEQAMAQKNLTVLSDVFGLGITAYEILCRQHPFQRDQNKIMRGVIPTKAADLVQCSLETSNLIEQMLQYRAIMRPNPEDIIRKLTGV